MAHTKEFARHLGLTFLLTYADNQAVQYFQKQGFSATISTPRERWAGYIKDYEESTLMESIINPHVNYLRLSDMIRRQRHRLLTYLSKFSNVGAVFDPPPRRSHDIIVNNLQIYDTIPYSPNKPPAQVAIPPEEIRFILL